MAEMAWAHVWEGDTLVAVCRWSDLWLLAPAGVRERRGWVVTL